MIGGGFGEKGASPRGMCMRTMFGYTTLGESAWRIWTMGKNSFRGTKYEQKHYFLL
jgi:hypothetical protein